MKKFGGLGKMKQTCVGRQCLAVCFELLDCNCLATFAIVLLFLIETSRLAEVDGKIQKCAYCFRVASFSSVLAAKWAQMI
jgi:hypothetical protein